MRRGEEVGIVAEHSQPARAAPPSDTLASRIEYLFDRIRPSAAELAEPGENGRRYSNREIADRINADARTTGVTISAAYVGELRRGVASDPRASHIRALAKAFGVDPAYFIDDGAAQRVREQIDLLNDLRRMDVRQVALRRVLQDTGLSAASATLVEQMVERLSAIEGAASAGPPGSTAGSAADSTDDGVRGS